MRRWLAVSSLVAAACARDDRFARARVVLSTAVTQGVIGSVTLVVEASPGEPDWTPGFPILVLMSGGSGGWAVDVSQIPAAGAVDRTFTATAFSGPDGTGVELYTGSTVATLAAGESAEISIVLQEVDPAPSGDFAPVIDSAASSAASLMPGQGGTLSAAAHDPDDPGHLDRPPFDGSPLAYLWTASCDAGSLAIDDPSAPSTAFTAPAVRGATCAVVLRVSETALGNAASASTSFTVSVQP